ncbi:ferric reductase-like transmembrane domain-containing protein [Jannaschia sp. R86511]|uniref:ferredoxin reductase family protein n=1 Tax=Jannaschia sp. R86511 TaxID=3093853 RepID=UPI0036D3BA85
MSAGTTARRGPRQDRPPAPRPQPSLARAAAASPFEARPDVVRRRRSRAGRADVLEAAAVLLLVGVLALFLRGGGGSDLVGGGAPGALVALGRLTGLLGTALLLLQLLLAARLPWVDRTYGQDRALAAHRRLSTIALPLLLAHAAALLVGYAVLDGLGWTSGWVVELWRLWQGAMPDMVTASLALAGLVVVAVTSVRAARRRVRHETWHLVHLLAYAAVVLSVPHQLSTGTDIAGSRPAQGVWLGAYLLTAGAVVLFRVLLPVARSLRHRLVVERVEDLGDGVVSVVMTGRALDRLPLRAGQYLNWRFLTPGLWAAAHPWSVSAAPDGRRVRITVATGLGDHSARLARLRPGTAVAVEGPYGAFTTERRTRRQVLLVAAGIGVTPVRALLEELVTGPDHVAADVTVLLRVPASGSAPLRAEVEQLHRRHGFRLLVAAGARARGSWLPAGAAHGGDARTLRQLVPDVRDHDVYVCGPTAWTDLVRRSLERNGVPAAQVHDERFSW